MSDDQLLNLQPGTIVNGRYEVVRCLGAGSMGMVYACRHRELSGRLVAMKVLFPEVASDETAKIRFENEIFASYEVNNPSVVRAYEYFHDGDLIAFTMEYIGGGDLADKLNSPVPLPVPRIVKMLRQMATGVAAIHQAGIIHRDLKPENILLTSQGDIKITDFGIARTGVVSGLTQHGGVVGTIDYVSPEYLEKGQVDERSDIYSLGVLAYEMITLKAPFSGNSVIETMTMRIKSDPAPPMNLRHDCPKRLNDIVMKALARKVEERYQTAEEMHEDLEDLEYSGELLEEVEQAAAVLPPPEIAGKPERTSEPLLPDELLSSMAEKEKAEEVQIERASKEELSGMPELDSLEKSAKETPVAEAVQSAYAETGGEASDVQGWEAKQRQEGAPDPSQYKGSMEFGDFHTQSKLSWVLTSLGAIGLGIVIGLLLLEVLV